MPVSGTSWALRYRADGASRKLTLGSFPALGIAQARRRAEEARGAIARGEDPASEKKAARAAAKAEREEKGDLIEKVVETFIERHAKRATRDWKETERLLKRNVIERWKGRRLSTITKWQVHDLLELDHRPRRAYRRKSRVRSTAAYVFFGRHPRHYRTLTMGRRVAAVEREGPRA